MMPWIIRFFTYSIQSWIELWSFSVPQTSPLLFLLGLLWCLDSQNYYSKLVPVCDQSSHTILCVFPLYFVCRDFLHVSGIDLYLLKHAERHLNILAVRAEVIALKRGEKTMFSTGSFKIKERGETWKNTWFPRDLWYLMLTASMIC